MKGSSKVIMGATLVMVVCLAIVLGLVLVLLVELYCTLLLRRRHLRATATTINTNANNTVASPTQLPQPQVHSGIRGSFYAQGVLHAPRSVLFPSVSAKDEDAGLKKQHSPLLQILGRQDLESSFTGHGTGTILASASPSASLITPHPAQELPLKASSSSVVNGCCSDEAGNGGEHFVYISNPIYDNDAGRPSRVGTPFETPDTSPSRLEMSGSSDEGEGECSSPASASPLPITPPLSPMKKLPAAACSVSLRDARGLGTSGSDSNSNNGLSSSSSGSPCTSPSW